MKVPSRIFLIVSTGSLTAKLLQITQLYQKAIKFRVSKSNEIRLPPNFQPTALLEVPDGNLLVLGSRTGALAIYWDIFDHNEMVKQITPVVCFRHIHGSDTVTHLRHLPAMNSVYDSPCYDILSTGRDGSYAIHKISFQNQEARSTIPTLTTLHRSFPPFGPNIEGATVIKTGSGGIQLLFHGFDGKNFVVWNEPSNSEIMNVPCGGAHRNWTYVSNYSSLPQGDTDQGGAFVWTKAGVFHLAKLVAPVHKIIQTGGHGREIKAMALYGKVIGHDTAGSHAARLIATGAEDTAIRLWISTTFEKPGGLASGHDRPQGTATCLRILKKHTTGIQHLEFCKELLFSSSGFEELFIWKINFGVSGVGIGTVLLDALPKHEAVSDLRITNFEVVSIPGGREAGSKPKPEQFLIYTAYSNSTVRVFKYMSDHTLPSESRFELLGEGFYNTTCLTQLSKLEGTIPGFVTAGTNGSIVLWPDLEDRDGRLDHPIKMAPVAEHFIHQNAVLALCVMQAAAEVQVLLTGGDDNAIGITLLLGTSTNMPDPFGSEKSQTVPTFGTLLIPRAHAAAITTLEILNMNIQAGISILTVASTGNDQRIKIWCITVNVDELSKGHQKPSTGIKKLGLEAVRSIHVQLLKETWTSVADASSMTVIADDSDAASTGRVETMEARNSRFRSLIVAGIGMEMIRLDVAEARDERFVDQSTNTSGSGAIS